MRIRGIPLDRWRAEAALAVATGAALIFLGSRYFAAAFIMVPSNLTLETLRLTKPVTPASLDHLIDNQSRALAWTASGAGWSNLSLALALEATQRSANDPEATILRDRAVQALEQSLRLAPANAYAWLRLALLRQAQAAPAPAVLDAWRLSVMIGPNESRLRIARIQLALAYWSTLTTADRQTVYTEIRNAWNADRESVLALADPFSVNVVRAALVTELKELGRFERMRLGPRPPQ